MNSTTKRTSPTAKSSTSTASNYSSDLDETTKNSSTVDAETILARNKATMMTRNKTLSTRTRNLTTNTTTNTTTTTSTTPPRTSPHLPTPTERLALGLFPALLVFGSVYAVVAPETRAMRYDAVAQSYYQPSDYDGGYSYDGGHNHNNNAVGSYFARKSNMFNVYFVKRGWAWTTLGLVAFMLSQRHGLVMRAAAAARWALLTAWWIVVVQWCFGAPLIDRGFRWTGGQCDKGGGGGRGGEGGGGGLAEKVATAADKVVTAAACKASGGVWRGGHDISGHVFLLTMGSAMLMHEVLWPLGRRSGWVREERCVVIGDGALKGVSVEAGMRGRVGMRDGGGGDGENKEEEEVVVVRYGGRFALAVLGLNLWMLLMTAIYFHTWFEKFTGLFTAYIGIYLVYYVPRFVPVMRRVVGVPGI